MSRVQKPATDPIIILRALAHRCREEAAVLQGEDGAWRHEGRRDPGGPLLGLAQDVERAAGDFEARDTE